MQIKDQIFTYLLKYEKYHFKLILSSYLLNNKTKLVKSPCLYPDTMVIKS